MWKTKNNGENYLIKDIYSKYPYEVDKKHLDWYLSTIKDYLGNLRSDLKKFYEEDKEALGVIFKYSYLMDKDNADEGELYFLESIYADMCDLEELLSSDDEFESKENLMTLEDLGFSKPYEELLYRKILSSDDFKEEREIIYINNPSIVHKKETTYWEKTKFGKESKRVEYDDLGVTDELKTIIENTLKRIDDSDEY